MSSPNWRDEALSTTRPMGSHDFLKRLDDINQPAAGENFKVYITSKTQSLNFTMQFLFIKGSVIYTLIRS